MCVCGGGGGGGGGFPKVVALKIHNSLVSLHNKILYGLKQNPHYNQIAVVVHSSSSSSSSKGSSGRCSSSVFREWCTSNSYPELSDMY